MPEKTLYEILEVSSNATSDAIRAAYERLSVKFDPDRPENAAKPDARIQFNAVKEAFLTLNNPAKRTQYDKTFAARTQPLLYNVEVVEPFWTVPKLIIVIALALGGGGYYYKYQKEVAKLEAQKAIAAQRAREAEEQAKAEAEQTLKARLELQRQREAQYVEERQRRERDIAMQRFSIEQQRSTVINRSQEERERRERAMAEAQRKREEAMATAAAQQRAARERAELCRIERERYGRSISC